MTSRVKKERIPRNCSSFFGFMIFDVLVFMKNKLDRFQDRIFHLHHQYP